MDTTTTYYGWSNRETWLANLWLTGNQVSNNMVEAVGRQHCNTRARVKMLERLVWEELSDQLDEPGLLADLLTTSFDLINWLEIVESNL